MRLQLTLCPFFRSRFDPPTCQPSHTELFEREPNSPAGGGLMQSNCCNQAITLIEIAGFSNTLARGCRARRLQAAERESYELDANPIPFCQQFAASTEVLPKVFL